MKRNFCYEIEKECKANEAHFLLCKTKLFIVFKSLYTNIPVEDAVNLIKEFIFDNVIPNTKLVANIY